MEVTPSKRKRPTCSSCSKPARLCLCTRIQTPPLENSVGVTILQHSLETKHALNSTRIAKLGLKNLTLATVFDVDTEARLVIRLLESGSGHYPETHKLVDGVSKREKVGGFVLKQFPKISQKIDQILASEAAIDDFSKGFVVKKLNHEQEEEFEIEVTAGSVLLYPSEKAMGVDDLKAMNYDVQNLIVLDGTWAKAKRMYVENPWLELLPHLKLEVEKMSLYGEVRKQPKAGCFSTIESIVYALKALGENSKELDNLLNVFQSMVGDQRRCKEERLSNVSVSPM
ncbi:hypothetical protein HS088_TW19G00148 [Tripterygium wilfordii]|uniref:tRNA-uridine aminocarboxypropyltransferase n=2 Tax=Tripterygium wilfordii TaxID=458696 RepID=A0A7J7C9M0_TRIWF|nr:hypothetical protein HS088_TW19G00148 [Tripterygium wilfordii]